MFVEARKFIGELSLAALTLASSTLPARAQNAIVDATIECTSEGAMLRFNSVNPPRHVAHIVLSGTRTGNYYNGFLYDEPLGIDDDGRLVNVPVKLDPIPLNDGEPYQLTARDVVFIDYTSRTFGSGQVLFYTEFTPHCKPEHVPHNLA